MFGKKNKKRGFTLIELIIVIAIIAILAAIAVPAFGQIRQKSNVSTDVANARTIYSMVASLVADETIELPADQDYYSLGEVGAGDNPVDLIGENGGDTQYLPSLSAPKAYQNSSFIVSLDKDGNIRVGVDKSGKDEIDVEIYPNPSGVYAGEAK